MSSAKSDTLKSNSTAKVTIAAGGKKRERCDGFGQSASFFRPYSIGLSGDDESLLIAEYGSNSIRRLFLASPESIAKLNRIVTAAVANTSLISVLIDIIIAYTADSMCGCVGVCVARSNLNMLY